MEESSIKIHKWLYPVSWLYGMGVALRNKLFDWGKLQSKSFNIPVICIGNIAVGGTGKTPHTVSDKAAPSQLPGSRTEPWIQAPYERIHTFNSREQCS